jgi:hypothetical protein
MLRRTIVIWHIAAEFQIVLCSAAIAGKLPICPPSGQGRRNGTTTKTKSGERLNLAPPDRVCQPQGALLLCQSRFSMIARPAKIHR